MNIDSIVGVGSGRITASNTLDYDPVNNVFIYMTIYNRGIAPWERYTWAYKYGNGSGVTQPAPTLSISASPSSIAYSGTSLITWSSTVATSCSTPWGSTLTGGTYTTPALTSNMTYSISCTGTGGTATGSVIVSVGSAPIQPG